MNSKREWTILETPTCDDCGSVMKGYLNEVKDHINNTKIEYETFYCPNCTQKPHTSDQQKHFGEGDCL